MKVEELGVEDINDFLNFYSNKERTIILGNSKYDHQFFAFTVYFENSEVHVGISSHSIFKPSLQQHGKSILVGFNEEVDIISDNVLIRSYHWESPFSQFVQLNSGEILLVFDSGVICLNKLNEKKWVYKGTDMITDCIVVEDRIEVSFLNGTKDILAAE